MNVPGGNVLSLAMRAIAKQAFTYYRFKTRADNGYGQDVTVYCSGIPAFGSLQPVPRNLYAQNGIDLQKNYINIFVSKNLFDIARDISGDQFEFCGRRYQALSKTDWFGVDGWDQVLCVEVPKP